MVLSKILIPNKSISQKAVNKKEFKPFSVSLVTKHIEILEVNKI